MLRASILVPVVLLPVLLVGARDRQAGAEPDVPSAAEKKILAALDSPVQLDFIDTQLSDAIDSLRQSHRVEIRLDKATIANAGLAPDMIPVTVQT